MGAVPPVAWEAPLVGGLLRGSGLAGNLVAQALKKHYWLALTDKRVLVCGVEGLSQPLPQIAYTLGQIGGKVIASIGLFNVHIEVQHPIAPFKAKFAHEEFPRNRTNAITIAEALQKG